MKKLIITLGTLTLLTNFIVLAEETRENNINFGLGVFYRNSVYKEKNDNEILPVPF